MSGAQFFVTSIEIILGESCFFLSAITPITPPFTSNKAMTKTIKHPKAGMPVFNSRLFYGTIMTHQYM